MAKDTSREDYEAVIEKYGSRLEVARAKFEDFKKDVATLDKALDAPAPATANEAARKDYEDLQKSVRLTMKDLGRLIFEYGDHFDSAARTLKLFR